MQNPRIYVVTVVNFGDHPAGSISVAALHKTAEMLYEEHPRESTIIENNSYMDDIIQCQQQGKSRGNNEQY